MTASDVSYFKETFIPCLKVMATYSKHELNIASSYGNPDGIQEMSEITLSPAIWPETQMTAEQSIMQKFITAANNIVYIYQRTGKIFFGIGAVGIIILMTISIVGIFKKKYEYLPYALITLGLIVSGSISFFSVQWFTSFLDDKKFYDYICCAIPIMQVAEVTGIYICYLIIKKIGRKKLKQREV